MHSPKVPVKDGLTRTSFVMLGAGAFLPLAYLIPPVDLTGPLAQAAYWASESGGTIGTPVIAIALIALLLCRDGLTWKQRGRELALVMLALSILFGGAAYLNEFVVKPYFKIPRPNILELAEPSVEESVLKKSADDFYDMPNKAVRSEYLKSILTPESTPPMDDFVRRHWIHETGFSFPSGHSFSAMLVATVFLALGLSTFSGVRLWAFDVPVGWAVAVSLSRPILRVHSPTDVCVGGFEGIAIGIVAFLLVRWSLVNSCPAENPSLEE